MSSGTGGTVDLAMVGDLILGSDRAMDHFGDTAETLDRADVVCGHVEWPHTERGQVSSADLPAPASPVAHLAALGDILDVATLAANHVFDQGAFGVADTVRGLNDAGVATTGAGMSLDEARIPVVVERAGMRIGFLSYNAVGPRESWATAAKAGAAYVRIHSHYELEMASPGSPPTEYTAIDAETLTAMCDDIGALAERVDAVVVALHKGVVFERARLAQYERPLARAAIDAGADVVVSHHAHILRGVEVYKQRPIFHGVNHFVTAYPPRGNPRSHDSTRARPSRSPIFDLVEPDTEVPGFPFSRASRHTMIATAELDGRGVASAGFVPCWIDERGHTVIARGERAEQVVDDVRAISRDAGLEADISWDGERAVFHTL